jgi:hypothetical protein
MYKWFDVVPQGLIVFLPFPFFIFGVFSWWFSCGCFEVFLFGIWWWMYAWILRGSFPCDSPLKSVSKGARFGGFLRFRVSCVLGGNPSIPLDLACFGGQNHSYGMPWGTPTVPNVLCKSVERIEISGWGFGRVDPHLAVHPERPGLTDLTSALHSSDWCSPLLGFGTGDLPGSCGFGLWCCWSVLGKFRVSLLGFVKDFLPLQICVWIWFLFQSLEESLRLPETLMCICCTHRPDRRCLPVWPVHCYTWFSKENQMHLICAPGSSLHTYDRCHEWNIRNNNKNVQELNHYNISLLHSEARLEGL